MTTPKTARTHHDVLEAIVAQLDIPDSLRQKAVRSYEALGRWLEGPHSGLASYMPKIAPQGSFLLGTVIRPLNERDEYDIDLICELQSTKQQLTPKQVKELVGEAIKRYANAHGMESPEEGRRCWTLVYADNARFHLDVLPCLPDAQGFHNFLESRGHIPRGLNLSVFLEHAIAITDRNSSQYNEITSDWPISNPLGYARWFRNRMEEQLLARKRRFITENMLEATVDDVPDFKVKTPLQHVVQLLKRHRDMMFSGSEENAPISIIITTLAAHAYNSSATVSEALKVVLQNMGSFIETRGHETWVVNPVNPEENFADKWVENPQKQQCFNEWLRRAQRDFNEYLWGSAFNQVPPTLIESIGNAAKQALGTIVMDESVATDKRARTQTIVNDTKRQGQPSKPWLNTP